MIGRLNDIVYSQGDCLQHSPWAPHFNYTPPGERLFADPPNSPRTHTTPTPQTTPSLLRVRRGVAAPPLVSLPLSKPSAVHRSPNWYAPSNLTVTSEGLMLRYQVGQTCRYWSLRTGLYISSKFRGELPRSLLGDCGMDARRWLSRFQRRRP